MGDGAFTVDGQIGRLTLRGPLDAAVVSRLGLLCERAADAGAVRVILLHAEPVTWEGWARPDFENAEALGLIGDPFRPLADLPQPVIAVLDAPLRDGGLELALCADLRVAGPAATFALSGVAAGDFPIAGGLQRLSRAVGRARALELALIGAPIDAETARRWGLVTAVAPDPAAEAAALAGRIAARGPLAVRLAKEAVHRGIEMPLEQALRYETDLTVLLQTTADRAEGVRAFLEKRTPRFLGQ